MIQQVISTQMYKAFCWIVVLFMVCCLSGFRSPRYSANHEVSEISVAAKDSNKEDIMNGSNPSEGGKPNALYYDIMTGCMLFVVLILTGVILFFSFNSHLSRWRSRYVWLKHFGATAKEVSGYAENLKDGNPDDKELTEEEKKNLEKMLNIINKRNIK